MNLSNDSFSTPLDDTPGSLFGEAGSDPIVGAKPTTTTPPSRAALAKWCGYTTEAEFLKESRRVATVGSTPWFATCDKVRGGWMLWRDPQAGLGHTSR